MKYTIEFQEPQGILVCRVFGFMDEKMSNRFGEELLIAQKAARLRTGQLRCLIDNREGYVASSSAATNLVQRFKSITQKGDRSAILVANSLSKLQAKRSVTSEHEIFVSENAAVTWLKAYDDKAGAAA